MIGSIAALVALSLSESLLDSTDDSEQASSPEPSSRLVALSWELGRQRYALLWPESVVQLLGSSTVTGSFSTETTEVLLVLRLLTSSGSVVGLSLFLLLSCGGGWLWTVYCRILLSSPPTTVTVLGNAECVFRDNFLSLSDRSVGAVKHRLGLIEALLQDATEVRGGS